MTYNTLRIVLECNGRKLAMGLGEPLDITAVTGLESSEFEISTSQNALVDGETVDGKKIKARPIHIEARFRSNADNAKNRAEIIKFFNPKYTGKALIVLMGVSRNIEYELEGWTFKKQVNMDENLKILVDLKCPDPYMLNVDNFGQNMAKVTPMFAFPWRVSGHNQVAVYDSADAGNSHYLRGCALQGHVASYKVFKSDVLLLNDGDVPTGVQIRFKAARGPVTNPKITNTMTGEYMRVKVAMEQGDELIIDTDEHHQIIELNGVNTYQKIDRHSVPFQLVVGDNYLVYDADSNYTNMDVYLYYRPKYLGV
jgi:hypothetical protein